VVETELQLSTNKDIFKLLTFSPLISQNDSSVFLDKVIAKGFYGAALGPDSTVRFPK